MLKAFRLDLESLAGTGKSILVAVSGGLDSIVLLDLLVRSNCKIGIAHANFQLRDQQSEGDETFVRQLAERLKVHFYSTRFSTNNYAIENGLSIQMAARELRYGWFDEIMDREKFDFLAIAHHANDNLETGLINFIRGTGLAGLKGMPVKNGRIIRPLLGFARKEIEGYALKNNLTWREDASNATDDYTRNFIRHQIVPKLKELNPSIEETFARNSERLAGSAELACWALSRLKETYVSEQGEQVIILKSIFDLFRSPVPILLELIKDQGFNFDQCNEIILSMKGQSGKQFLSDTHRIIVDRESLILVPQALNLEEVKIQKGQNRAEMGRLMLELESVSKDIVNANNLQAILALDKLQFPLIWRKWKPGDFFFPLGMDHKKKLSDFLIDKKISLADKDNVTVLESGGEIVWVVGYRIDNRFRIIESGGSRLVISLRRL